MQDVRKTFNIKIKSPFWDDAAKKADGLVGIPEWLADEYLLAIDKEYALFTEGVETFIRAANYIRENENLLALSKILYFILDEKKPFAELFSEFETPVAPDGAADALGYDYLAAIVVSAHVKPYTEDLLRRGITKEIIKDTFYFFRRFLTYYKRDDGSHYFDKAFMMNYSIFVYKCHIWIGRLRYEIQPDATRNIYALTNADGETCVLMYNTRLHKSGHILGSFGYTDEDGAYDADFVETDEYFEGYPIDPETHLVKKERIRLSKNDWRVLFKDGDTVLKIHFAGGTPLDSAACDESIRRARELFKEGFPEYKFSIFACRTWAFCPTFREILKPGANLNLFRDKFVLYPVKSNANDVFLYVYEKDVKTPDEVDFTTLPENTSMQKNVKQKLLDGENFHEFNGLIPF